MKKVYVVLMLVTLLTVAVVVSGFGKRIEAADTKEEVKERRAVKTVEIKEELIKEVVSANGEILPVQEVLHESKTSGEVVKIYKRSGDFVKVGENVVDLHDDKIESAYLTAEANYIIAKSNYERELKFSEFERRNQMVQAETSMVSAQMTLDRALRGADQQEIDNAKFQVESAKKNYEVASRNYEKNRRLYKKNLISEQNYLNIENTFKSAENQYKIAEKNLELVLNGTDEEDINRYKANLVNAKEAYKLQEHYISDEAWKYNVASTKGNMMVAKANYEYAKRQYEDLQVKAKISGLIADLDIEEYNEVKEDEGIYNILKVDEMSVKVGVSAKEFTKLSKNAEVKLYIEDLGKTYKGSIYEMNPTTSKNTNKFTIKIKIDNKNRKLIKGMYAKVDLTLDSKKALVVPKKSIVIENLYKYVFINRDGKAKKLRVQTGVQYGDKQEIISEELKSGDKIVIEGQFLLEDNEYIEEVM